MADEPKAPELQVPDISSNIRILLYTITGGLVSNGVINASTQQAIIGLLMLVGTYLWTMHGNSIKRRVARMLDEGEASTVVLNNSAVANELPQVGAVATKDVVVEPK